MSTLLFYDTVTPLNRERHKDLKLKPADGDVRFAARTHFVPLAGVEFMQAARDYPIIFSGSDEYAVSVALLGLTSGQNLFVDETGRWSPGTYLPAFVRRYPFVLATAGKDSEKGDEDSQPERASDYTVCVDENYPGFSRDEGRALFEDGNESAFLQEMMQFLTQFRAEMERTQTFVRRLREHDLLTRRDLQVSGPDGGSFLLKGFDVVNEERFAALEEKAVVQLHQEGFLPWVYAHAMSLGNMARLPQRLPKAA